MTQNPGVRNKVQDTESQTGSLKLVIGWCQQVP